MNTIMGRASVLGEDTGWNTTEFMAAINAHPEADIPVRQFGEGVATNMTFLQAAVINSIDDYIDWGSGTSHFDTDGFVGLLELAGTFPDESEMEKIWQNTPGAKECFTSGRSIMSISWMPNFVNYKGETYGFGGDIVFKGFPNENRNGNYILPSNGLSIIEQSANKEGAWAFVRTILTKDYQLGSYLYMNEFPSNKDVFDEMARIAMEVEFRYSDYDYGTVSQAEVEQVRSLISSASGIAVNPWHLQDLSVEAMVWNIVSEEASNYFGGAITSRQASINVQSRVSLLVSERS